MTFGFYGLMRKTATLGALEGMSLETMLLAPGRGGAAVGWPRRPWQPVARARHAHLAVLPAQRPRHRHPAAAVRRRAWRVPLSTMGFCVHHALHPGADGRVLYGETFWPPAVGFVFIWVALALYTAEGLWAGRRAAAAEQQRRQRHVPRATVTRRPAGAVVAGSAQPTEVDANHPQRLFSKRQQLSKQNQDQPPGRRSPPPPAPMQASITRRPRSAPASSSANLAPSSGCPGQLLDREVFGLVVGQAQVVRRLVQRLLGLLQV